MLEIPSLRSSNRCTKEENRKCKEKKPLLQHVLRLVAGDGLENVLKFPSIDLACLCLTLFVIAECIRACDNCCRLTSNASDREQASAAGPHSSSVKLIHPVASALNCRYNNIFGRHPEYNTSKSMCDVFSQPPHARDRDDPRFPERSRCHENDTQMLQCSKTVGMTVGV